jgi:hypothetical protein
VVLELGAGVGALVLYTPADMDGREIEISCDDQGGGRTHSQVRPRHMATGTRYAAVYPEVAAGPYTIWADERRAAGRVEIAGARVTNWSWPA